MGLDRSHRRFGGIAGGKLALIGFDPVEAERLTCLLAEHRCLSRTFDRDAAHSRRASVALAEVVVFRHEEDAAGMSAPLKRPFLVIADSHLTADSNLRTDTYSKTKTSRLKSTFRDEEFLVALQGLVTQSHPPSETFRALIVDDDPDIRRICGTLMQNLRMECHLATNGQQGLSLAEELMPNLILLDIEMPLLSGFEVLAKIRENPCTRGTIVVMFTGRSTGEDVARGSSLGADGYIVKPFTFLEVTVRIRRIVDGILRGPVQFKR
jgi:CheY-like chemotaxis protein